MTLPPRLLAVIPARGGSKGLPGKNTRPLCGMPLICHAVKAAAMTKGISKAIVSTDSEEIAEIARACGADVPFLRPSELAHDDTPMAPVLTHALAAVEEMEGQTYDAVILLDPTSPARRPDQLVAAAERLWADPSLDGVISVSEPTFRPSWVGVRFDGDSDVLERFYAEGTNITRRQDTERYLRINGNFYVWRAEYVRRLENSWFDEGVHAGFEIPESQAFSIDDEYEFRLVEALVGAGLVTLPWMD